MADTTKMTKAQLLAELRAEQDGFEALLGAIGAAHMTQPGVAADWSVKDIVAHLTGWRHRTVGRFQALLRGQPAPPPPWPAQLATDDEINAWIYAANRDRPLSDVLADARDTFERLLAVLAAFPEDTLLDPTRFGWPAEQPVNGAAFFSHLHEEHEPDLRAWLERVRREEGSGQQAPGA
jgi:hypothetical protein